MMSFSGPYFRAFELNTEIYSVNLRIQSACGEKRTKKTPITDIFQAGKDSNTKTNLKYKNKIRWKTKY